MDQVYQKITAIILGAGKGTRMNSTLPKVLHKISDKTLLDHVISRLDQASIINKVVVINSDVDAFREVLEKHHNLNFCVQGVQNGTAGAVAAAGKGLLGTMAVDYAPSELIHGQPIASEYVLVCFGDTPALDPNDIKELVSLSLQHDSKISVLGMKIDDPTGYGRLVMEGPYLERIVEEKDASEEIKKIQYCNSGIIFAKTKFLFKLLSKVTSQNKQNEYYLTDCIHLARELGEKALVHFVEDSRSLMGINDQVQLKIVSDYIVSQ